MRTLLRLFVRLMLAAHAAELAELQPLRRLLLILVRHVVARLAHRTLENNIVSRHVLLPSPENCPT